MEQKLSRFAEEDDDLAALLDDFQQRGWLSEQRFTEQLTHARKSRFGSLRIAHELREHGVAEELVEKALAELSNHELDHARSVLQKKFGGLPENHAAWTRQARFLQGRGFSFEVIKQALKPDPDETV